MHPESKTKPAQRALLLSIPGDALSQCAIDVLEREIPDIVVRPLGGLEAACQQFGDPVRLILVDARHADELAAWMHELESWHPSASVALIADDQRVPLSRYRHLALGGGVRGVLPMNLRLDLWLSVVRLLANGGEYFPAALLQSQAVASAPPPRPNRNDIHPVSRPPSTRGNLGELTHREIQVLDLVSRGRQNKTIAADLNLSEHTVKVHLHNIISKMQVSNRTEAASIYLERRPVNEMSRTNGAVSIALEEPR